MQNQSESSLRLISHDQKIVDSKQAKYNYEYKRGCYGYFGGEL
ncbi:hypothetical protein PPEP_b0640 [Pseudoalteromonas peptidolytica F12-50-A1]|uniref:Uncharacterized protein n=1 Tax=Pseudoalteromonas peptidolytica F12-50-A1 TaxID=1315280 RepID=A0A8I0N0S9_9GAMM|nr:hypothetical protein [Pseudoalteromonas peptidolytica F12-50-A1]